MAAAMPQEKGTFRARHMGLLLLGAFLVVAGVNGVFIYYALTSWTGETDRDAYAKGVAYNDEIARRARQEALGWKASLSVTPGAAGTHDIEVVLEISSGFPLTGASVQAEIRRPTQESMDLSAALGETAPGTYVANVMLPAKGQWDILITAEQGGESFKAVKRVAVP